MGTTVRLTAGDGHVLSAYRADPAGAPRGGIVVIQEIFGVNHHIRAICDRLAAQGYLAVAPAVFDRFAPGFETGYSAAEVAAAIDLAFSHIDMDHLLLDVAAAQKEVAPAGATGILGFCLGGSVAFVAASRLPGLAAASCFYGGMIAQHADEKPNCPTEMYFGEFDDHIPMSDVEAIRVRRPECPVLVYPAGHGFNCDERDSFHGPSAADAWARTLALFERSVARP